MALKFFCPNYYIKSYQSLRIDFLKEKGIKTLFCDIDNTLIPHDVALPDEYALAFVERLKEANIQVIFISNNVEERVSLFAKACGAPYYPFALKPLPKTYLQVLKDYHLNKSEVAVLGDQLLTDMLGANLVGLYTILTAPVVERDLSFTKFNRFFEAIVFKILRVMGKLKKGEFDE